MTSRVRWSDDDERWLRSRLDAVNGRRTARRLEPGVVKRAVDQLLESNDTCLVVHGGDVDDARQFTSLALLVQHEGAVVLGLGVSRTGPASPARAFADLPGWELWVPGANRARCERWASRAGADRRRLALAPTASTLLDAISNSPDDDGPRLVYADWLLERGDPRGEFIHLQCELAGRDDGALLEREAQLLSANEARWLGPLAGRAGCRFRRGFLDELTVLDLDAVEEARELLSRELVRRLVFSARRRVDPNRVLAWPWLARLERLSFKAARDVAAPLGLDGLRTLLEAPRWRQLREIGFVGQALGDEGARLLAATSELQALERFSLSHDELSAGGLAALVEAPWLRRLVELSLVRLGLDGDCGERLAAVPFRRLEQLALSSNRLGDRGARALAVGQGLRQLRVLWLTSNRISPAGAEALLQSQTLSGARVALDFNQLGRAFDERLAARAPEPLTLATSSASRGAG